MLKPHYFCCAVLPSASVIIPNKTWNLWWLVSSSSRRWSKRLRKLYTRFKYALLSPHDSSRSYHQQSSIAPSTIPQDKWILIHAFEPHLQFPTFLCCSCQLLLMLLLSLLQLPHMTYLWCDLVDCRHGGQELAGTCNRFPSLTNWTEDATKDWSNSSMYITMYTVVQKTIGSVTTSSAILATQE